LSPIGEPWHDENTHHAALNCYPIFIPLFGFGSSIGRGLFVGWVEHPDIFCWVSFLYPTYLSAIFVLSAKPNKMVEDRIIPPLFETKVSGVSIQDMLLYLPFLTPETKFAEQKQFKKLSQCASSHR